MAYAICFDFPEVDDPVFAGIAGETYGFAPRLETALRFDDETAAINTLRNAYGDETRSYGVVVEVA